MLGPGLPCCPELPGHQRHHRPSRCLTGGQSPDPEPLTASLSPRYDEGSGGSGDEGRDEAHKREWNLFYQKQMSLRKVKGAGLHGVTGVPCSPLGPSLALAWELSCRGAGALVALHVTFQGKDPKIEEFVPPGECRHIPWAVPGRGRRMAPGVGVWGAQAGGRVEACLFSPDESCPLKEASSRKLPRLTVKVRGGPLGSPLPPKLSPACTCVTGSLACAGP